MLESMATHLFRFVVFAASAAFLAPPADAHPGSVRRSGCTHVDRSTGERHAHPGRRYCDAARGRKPGSRSRTEGERPRPRLSIGGRGGRPEAVAWFPDPALNSA